MATLCRTSQLLQKILPATRQRTEVCSFSTSNCRMELRKQARVKVVDNSALGRSAAMEGKFVRIIQVYNPSQVGTIGDLVLVTVKGEMKKALIVGCKQNQKSGVPKFDSNNVILLEDNGNPIGTRIKVPIPSIIRKKAAAANTGKRACDFAKILSLATKFY